MIKKNKREGTIKNERSYNKFIKSMKDDNI